MKNVTILLTLLFTVVFSFGQDLINVKGKIQLISYFQGGMELPEEYRSAKPNPNVSVIIVKYNGPKAYSTYVSTVSSDSVGNFNINLSPGKYGFVLVDQKKQLKKKKGIYQPQQVDEKESGGAFGPKEVIHEDIAIVDYWYMNVNEPFKVDESLSQELIITHYSVSVCYLCP